MSSVNQYACGRHFLSQQGEYKSSDEKFNYDCQKSAQLGLENFGDSTTPNLIKDEKGSNNMCMIVSSESNLLESLQFFAEEPNSDQIYRTLLAIEINGIAKYYEPFN